MKILILTQWFEPEPTSKGLLFARELVTRGHEVEVLTGSPNYP
jgi:colanic acid biosynthesis glycosyl transferase WcaI